MGNTHRPFYRIVVQKSASGRNSSAIETIGTYNPVSQPKEIRLKADRAMHWLLEGAQPTETVAVILKREGVLEDFFAQRPKARKKFAFLDRTTAAMSKESVLEAPKAEEAPVAVAEPVAEPAVEEPAVEEAPVEATSEESADVSADAAEETKSE